MVLDNICSCIDPACNRTDEISDIDNIDIPETNPHKWIILILFAGTGIYMYYSISKYYTV